MKRIDCFTTVRNECGVLLHAMRMKAIDPENRILLTVTDSVAAIVLWKLHHPPHSECAKRRIVEGGRARDIRDSDTRVIDHFDTPL